MRFAPIRSARNPQTILPLSEPTPARLNTVAAAIAPTPWSMALATMWKMGPECAAQQAKKVSAAGPADPAGTSTGRTAGGSRRSRAAGRMTTHASSPITSMAVRQS